MSIAVVMTHLLTIRSRTIVALPNQSFMGELNNINNHMNHEWLTMVINHY